MVVSNCDYCGNEKEYKHKSNIRRFCSYSCARKGVPKAPAKKTTINCIECEKDFDILKSSKKSRERNGKIIKFCSKSCEGINKTKKLSVSCKNCHKKFLTTRNSYCSRGCSFEHQKKTGIRKRSGYWFEHGYKVIYLEGDKSIKEHIKIMQEHIGRVLTPSEVVHHINEVRADNRIENLQLMTRSEHSSYHRKKEMSEGKELFARN